MQLLPVNIRANYSNASILAVPEYFFYFKRYPTCPSLCISFNVLFPDVQITC